MASQETHLALKNYTWHEVTNVHVDEVDNYDWDGDSRPDHNFQDVSIPSPGIREEQEEVNYWARSAFFRMRLRFANGTEIRFRVDQRDAFTTYDRPLQLEGPDAGRYLGRQVSGSGRNVLSIVPRPPPTSWMSGLPDDRLLSELSVPGTHDSGALVRVPFVQCQEIPIRDQLQMGVRFLDVRLRLVSGVLRVYHSWVPQGESFEDVVGEIRAFLAANPRETLLVSIKDEDDGGDAFAEAVEAATSDEGLFWAREYIPSLGEVRGRAVVMRRYVSKRAWGLDLTQWPNDSTFRSTTPNFVFAVEDVYYYAERSFSALDDKWAEVASHLDTAAKDAGDVLYLTFASATGPPILTPWLFAAGVDGYQGMVRRLSDRLAKPARRRLGIIPMDYPDAFVVNAVVCSNFPP